MRGAIEVARMAERLTQSPAERLYSGSNPDPGLLEIFFTYGKIQKYNVFTSPLYNETDGQTNSDIW